MLDNLSKTALYGSGIVAGIGALVSRVHKKTGVCIMLLGLVSSALIYKFWYQPEQRRKLLDQIAQKLGYDESQSLLAPDSQVARTSPYYYENSDDDDFSREPKYPITAGFVDVDLDAGQYSPRQTNDFRVKKRPPEVSSQSGFITSMLAWVGLGPKKAANISTQPAKPLNKKGSGSVGFSSEATEVGYDFSDYDDAGVGFIPSPQHSSASHSGTELLRRAEPIQQRDI